MSKSSGSSAWNDSGQGEPADKKGPSPKLPPRVWGWTEAIIGCPWDPNKKCYLLGEHSGLSWPHPQWLWPWSPWSGLYRESSCSSVGRGTESWEGSCRDSCQPHAEGRRPGPSHGPSEAKDQCSSVPRPWAAREDLHSQSGSSSVPRKPPV